MYTLHNRVNTLAPDLLPILVNFLQHQLPAPRRWQLQRQFPPQRQLNTTTTTTIMSATSIITDPVLTSVLAAAHETRQQCNSILDFISSQNASASASASVYEDTQLLTAQKTLSTRLAILRGLNRKAILSVRNTKHETSEKRQEIDALHLQLQNLYYEQRHLRGEIRACEDYEFVFSILIPHPTSIPLFIYSNQNKKKIKTATNSLS